jgi:hypothetical protein
MSQKNPPKRRLLDGGMSLISLVPRGANQVQVLFKDDRVRVELLGVAKMDSEGLLTSLVYVPERPDSQGDVASAEVIKQYCHDFIKNMDGNGIDVMHDCKPVGNDRAQVCENFVVQKGDPRFEGIKDSETGELINPEGAWGTVIKIHDPVLKAPYESGDWCGVSMFGSALVEPLTKFDNQPDPEEDQEMDETKFEALLKTFGADLSTTIVEGISKALKPKEKKVEKTEVKFEGDPTNAEDIAKHKDALFLANCDLTTLEGLAKWEQYLVKKTEAEKPEDVKELEKELEALQARIDKAEKASAADPKDSPVQKGGTLAEKLARGKARAQELKKSGVL